MSNEEIRNARIESTFLGIEDHGIMTFFLHLEGEGWGQGFGGYVCSGSFLAESVRKVLEVLEVESWEKLPGTMVRCVGTDSRLTRIGHIYKNKWYDIEAHGKKASEGKGNE